MISFLNMYMPCLNILISNYGPQIIWNVFSTCTALYKMSQEDEKEAYDKQELVLRKEFLDKVSNDQQLKDKLASFPSKDDRLNYINTQMTEYVKLNMQKMETKKQNDIKNKCNNIISQLSSSITTPLPLQHDNDHGNNWEYICSMAEICLDPFHEFINNLTNSLKLFTCNTNINIIKPPLKEYKSSNEKVNNKYNGNWLQLIDVCRARIVYTNYKQLYFILLIIAKYNTNCFGFQVIQITNNNYITLYIEPAKKQSIDNNIKLEYTSQEQKLLESIKTNTNQQNESDNEIDSEEDDENENVSGLPGHICELQIIHETQQHMLVNTSANISQKSDTKQQQSIDNIEAKSGDVTLEEIKEHSMSNDVQYGVYNECFDISDSIINSNKLWETETNGYKKVSLNYDDAQAVTEFSILLYHSIIY